MKTGQKLKIVLYIAAAITAGIILLLFSPLSAAPPDIMWYYTLIAVFCLLLFAAAMINQLRKRWQVKYKSYLDQNNSLKKKLLRPTMQELREAFAACCARPRYILCGGLLLLVFYINYLLVFVPGGIAGLPGLLFDYNAAGRIEKSNIWLAVTCLCVLFLSGVILRQNYYIRLNGKLANRQNLIINAHSNIALANMDVLFTDINKMFLSASKLEYILNAKPVAGLRQLRNQALLNLRVHIKLNNDYSVTEFYIRQLSLFVEDMVIECDNYQNKFYQVFAEDNEFVLNFYIRFAETNPDLLMAKLADSPSIKIYYNFVVKNSFSVITDLYGSAVYEQVEEQSADSLQYITRDARGNQYFYI